MIGNSLFLQVVCDTAKVRFFKQITTCDGPFAQAYQLFAILQKYDFSSKSQPSPPSLPPFIGCLRYCKSTIFQANHNHIRIFSSVHFVVCDTAKVRFFKQITTRLAFSSIGHQLFAILQKYDFSSKSQRLRSYIQYITVVCDTAKVRFFKQITTADNIRHLGHQLFAILQKYDFSSKSQRIVSFFHFSPVVCDTAKVRFFKQITTPLQCSRQ